MSVAVQLARLAGFSPIITTASTKYTTLLKSLGATHIIDRTLPLSDLPSTVEGITLKPIQYVYDSISDPEIENAGYDILSSGGVLAIVLPDVVDKAKVTTDKQVVLALGSPHVSPEMRALGVEIYKHITTWFDSGELTVSSYSAVSCAVLIGWWL